MQEMKDFWLPWIGATATAAVGATFALITYVHANFITVREKDDILRELSSIKEMVSFLYNDKRSQD